MMELKGRIIVYSILGCPHCMKAKNTLVELGLPYHDIRLDIYPHVRKEVQERTGRKTVPQIFFNSKHIGGNEDLKNLGEDELAKLIEDVKLNSPSADAPTIPDPSTATQETDAGDFVCEPDEYAELVRDLKGSGIIQDHRKGLHSYKNSFSGKDFVDWMCKTKHVERNEAVDIGQHLIDSHFGHRIKSEETFQDTDTLYRLLEDDETTALNAGSVSECAVRSAGDLGEDIRKMILKLYAAFLSPDGKKVNYKGIAASAEFESYERLTKELQRVRIEDAGREEKIAFFTNIYNALVIHANIRKGPPVNLWQRYKFFNTTRYIIGGNAYSLQDMENGVLRANRKGVGMLTRPFGKSDLRLKIALEAAEPLIHFALVCGAKSCPPIKTYTTEGVMEEMRMAAEAFLEGSDGCTIDFSKKIVKLSQIFKWYRVDFGKTDEEVLLWVFSHMSGGEKKVKLKELLKMKNYKIQYMNYDWGINSSD